jgi:DNA-binding winged helix-turn-helix (wHTH) protein
VPSDGPDQTSASTGIVYRFGQFEVRTESGELFRNSVRVPVQEQSLRVLIALLERPGSVVLRDQLQERLWPQGTFVDFEHSLNAAVKRLRAALEDDADNPRFIETLPRRGYRLIVEVESEQVNADRTASAPQLQMDAPVSVEGRHIHLKVVRGAIMLLLLVSAIALMLKLQIRRPASAFDNKQAAMGNVMPPQKEKAIELYLRSLAYKTEPPDNSQAIALLERSIAMDSTSARSWYELARRYHSEHNPGDNGVAFLQKAREANQKALDLDADFSPARLHQVMLDVEVGQLEPAYRAAQVMVGKNPRDANAHFAVSYVLRSGGMFDESARECDRALALDSSNIGLRSCGLVFILLGRYERASTYLDLDPLSSYVRFRRLELALLANNRGKALELARSIHLDPLPDYPEARLIEVFLSGASAQALLDQSRKAEAIYDKINLPEGYFVSARFQSIAGQTEPALRLLRRAIANNYCAYPAIDSDPLLANVRKLPEYGQLRRDGTACRENFKAIMRNYH